VTKEQKDKIEAQSMCYADVSSAYYLGKKFALMYENYVLGTSATPFSAKQARKRFQNQLGVEDVKIAPLEKVIREPKKLIDDRALKKIGRKNYDAEVKRITDLLKPVNDEEREAVKEVAVDNLIKKQVMEYTPWGTPLTRL
tara:strand:+ start:93 stop:515 length:423 start_codon:yes stop_codon:yes gene_type:complete